MGFAWGILEKGVTSDRKPVSSVGVPESVLTSSPLATSLTLIRHAYHGDDAAWHRLVRLYTPLVLHWCRRWNVRGADADDMVQEVFQSAAAGLANFRRDRPGDTFRGWLRGIARNKLMDLFRRRDIEPAGTGGSTMNARLQQIPDSLVSIASSSTQDDPEDSQVISDLFRHALNQVRNEFEERTWQAFWRTTVDGQRPVDVAQEFGLSPAAVRMAKCRVLRRVRQELGERVA